MKEPRARHLTASNLSHLLHKHPDRAQAFPLSVGTAHVFYPVVSDERCTVAMLLEVDPTNEPALETSRKSGHA